MKIELKEITVKELVKGYVAHHENGVIGYDGLLDIRPPYQREFIYKDKQRDAVIETVFRNFPLNVMYWAVRDDGTFEVIDGQQRTISLCQYLNGDFSFHGRYFHNLQDDEQENILNYKLMIYHCEGSNSEKLKWFETINIAGEKLTNQELLNAVFTGPWVTDAKKYFSKNGCPAYAIGKDYLVGSPIRQEFLETAIKWISNNDIKDYMGIKQFDSNASELWEYFQNVIDWLKSVFVVYRREMKGVNWGSLYNDYSNKELDHELIEIETKSLMLDDDVTNKKGIYEYLLTRKEKHLSIRSFTENQKRETYERQNGLCAYCNQYFDIKEMEADHITPWHSGGKTISENCQLLCKEDNRRKSGI